MSAFVAAVDSFGVGERLITASSEAVFGGVYKLAAVEKDGKIIPKIKISENTAKITIPGVKIPWRLYDKETGKFIVDTINEKPSELSSLKNREYNNGYSYEMLANSDKGYSSFKSIRTGENLYIHYSTIEDFNWGIMLARY